LVWTKMYACTTISWYLLRFQDGGDFPTLRAQRQSLGTDRVRSPMCVTLQGLSAPC
jgi:hypothetical protein